MLSLKELELALKNTLPVEATNLTTILARVLIDLLENKLSQEGFQQLLANNPSWANALGALRGRKLDTQKAVIYFGSDLQAGEIQLRDIAGGDLTTYNVNIHLGMESANTQNTLLEHSKSILTIREELNTTIDQIQELKKTESAPKEKKRKANSKVKQPRPKVILAKTAIMAGDYAGFWEWFTENTQAIEALAGREANITDYASDSLVYQIAFHLNRVSSDLSYELGKVDDAHYEFIISADGIKDRFSTVLRMVSAAPPLPKWRIIPFRQAKEPYYSITIKKDNTPNESHFTLSPDDVFFQAFPNWDKLDLQLFFRDYTSENQELIHNASFLLLDSLIGEFDVATKIGGINYNSLPKDPTNIHLHSITELPELLKNWRPVDPFDMLATLSSKIPPSKVYLACTKSNYTATKSLYKRLLKDGFSPWLDDEDILPGQDLQRAKEKALRMADITLVILTSIAVADKIFVQQEISNVIKLLKRRGRKRTVLIPVRLEDCQVPKQLERLQCVNLYEKSGYSKLVQALNAYS